MRVMHHHHQRGQILALGVIAMTALILATALVIDGGFVFAKRREVQNAADFAAMAGTRIVGVAKTGRPPGAGTAANVASAVTTVLADNGAQLAGAQYVDEAGNALGNVVGAGSIPAGAFGVVVDAVTDYQPYLLGLIGIFDWQVSARATAVTPGESVGGDVLPIGLRDTVFPNLEACEASDLFDCADSLTGAQKNIPGGFGWLKFGLNNGNKCDWGPSLGMDDGGCESSKTFLDEQIGPPSNSYGCCGPVGEPEGSSDLIGSLTGNEWGDLSAYIEGQDSGLGADLGCCGRAGREWLVPHRRLRTHLHHR